VTCLVLPPRSPNLNAHAERWVRLVKEKCLSCIVLFGERAVHHTLKQYEAPCHAERSRQGKGNAILLPSTQELECHGPVQCCERLDGLRKYYHRTAA
jgi:putative transposase